MRIVESIPSRTLSGSLPPHCRRVARRHPCPFRLISTNCPSDRFRWRAVTASGVGRAIGSLRAESPFGSIEIRLFALQSIIKSDQTGARIWMKP